MAGRPYIFNKQRGLDDAKSSGLLDAREAGTVGNQCTLIITEGVSATKFVVRFILNLSVILNFHEIYLSLSQLKNVSFAFLRKMVYLLSRVIWINMASIR